MAVEGARAELLRVRIYRYMVHCSSALLIKLSWLLWDRSIERVAVLVGKKTGKGYEVLDVLRADNEDSDPKNMFFISYRQLSRLAAKAEQKGYTVLGIAHSHPANHPALPSIADMQNCVHSVNAVYHPATRSLTWFNQQGELLKQRIEPLAWLTSNTRNLPH